MSIISRNFRWYLAEISASIINFENIVVINQETINKYNLQPGGYIKVSNLFHSHSSERFSDKFILLPYFREIIDNYLLLQDVLQSLVKKTYHYVDKEYIGQIINLINCFYQANTNKSRLKLKVLLDVEEQDNNQMKIALPEFWLNEHNIDLGEIVVLRNDSPSPIFF